MTLYEGYILGLAAIGFLSIYASVNVKKDEVPVGRYMEKSLLYGLGILSIIAIALLMVLEAENGGLASHYLDFANAWFVGVGWGGFAIFASFMIYVLIKSISYFNSKREKSDEDNTK